MSIKNQIASRNLLLRLGFILSGPLAVGFLYGAWAAVPRKGMPPEAPGDRPALCVVPGHAFKVDTPEGWVPLPIKPTKRAPNPPCLNFVLGRDVAAGRAHAAIFAFTIQRDPNDAAALDHAVSQELENLSATCKAAKQTGSVSPDATAPHKIHIRLFRGCGDQSFKNLAWVEAGDVFAVIALQAKTQKAFESSGKAFSQVVDSVSIMSRMDMYKTALKWALEDAVKKNATSFLKSQSEHVKQLYTLAVKECMRPQEARLPPSLVLQLEEKALVSEIYSDQDKATDACLRTFLMGKQLGKLPFTPFFLAYAPG